MQVKAAIAWKAGEPLSIETVDLESPRAGEVLVEMKAAGVRHNDAYTLSGADPVGNGHTMGQALEYCHRGWGESLVIGVASAGQGISTRPLQLVTGRVWKGSAFGGARGRTDVPRIVDGCMEGEIDIDSLISETLPLDRINDAFHHMNAGETLRSVVVD